MSEVRDHDWNLFFFLRSTVEKKSEHRRRAKNWLELEDSSSNKSVVRAIALSRARAISRVDAGCSARSSCFPLAMMPVKKEAGGAEEEEDARERDVGAASCSSLDPPDQAPAQQRSSSSSPPSSVLVLFRGLPGVGKSTFARAVSLELGNAPLVDKDDTRDALAEVFSEREEEEEEEDGGGGQQGQRDGDELFRQRLNEASYASAFNAARTLLSSSLCPCVLLDSPLSRPSAAERALRLAEELGEQGPKKEGREESDGGAAAPSSSPSSSLAFVVVAVGTSDEGLWRRRLEARGAALAASGSLSARHKPGRWSEVEALRDRGRRELLRLLGEQEEEEEEGQKEKNGGGGGGGGERGERGSERSGSTFPSFRERALRDLGVDRPSSLPFSRLWRAASARFVVDTAAAGEEGREGAFLKAAARSVAVAVRSALAGERADGDDDGDDDGSVVFLGGR